MLLDSSALPFWAYIVIITVGSLLVLGTLALMVVYCVRRKRANRRSFDSELGADRKLTLRRGRLVPSSNYLSLTGSLFGLGGFVNEEGDHGASARARSRSPFEWWKGMQERSHSRHSMISQADSGHVEDHMGIAESKGVYVHGPKDFATPSHSLSSNEKETSVVAREVGLTRSSSSSSLERPSRNTNFSRSFSLRAPSRPRNHKLSRIEETSPHASMSMSATVQMARLSALNTNVDKNMFEIRKQNASPATSSDPSEAQSPRSLARSASDSRLSATIVHEPIPELPKAVVHRRSRTDLNSMHQRRPSSSSRRTSTASRRDSMPDRNSPSSRRSRSVHADALEEKSDCSYQAAAEPPVPKTPPRKVLRKKSLRKMEMVSRLDA